MTTTIIINDHLQHAIHWPKDFTDPIKTLHKTQLVGFLIFVSQMWKLQHGYIIIWPKSHSECGRMRFPSTCLNQQQFTSTEVTSQMSNHPFVYTGLALVPNQLLTAQAGLGREGPAIPVSSRQENSLWKGLARPYL